MAPRRVPVFAGCIIDWQLKGMFVRFSGARDGGSLKRRRLPGVRVVIGMMLAMSPVEGSAQSRFLRLGGVRATVGPSDAARFEPRHGLSGGVGISVRASRFVDLRLGAEVVQKGVRQDRGDIGQSVHVDYLEMPVLLALRERSLRRVSPRLAVGVAPSIHLRCVARQTVIWPSPGPSATVECREVGAAPPRIDLVGRIEAGVQVPLSATAAFTFDLIHTRGIGHLVWLGVASPHRVVGVLAGVQWIPGARDGSAP